MVPNTARAHAAFSPAHFRRAQMFAMTSAIVRSPMLPVAKSKMAVINVHIMAAWRAGMMVFVMVPVLHNVAQSSRGLEQGFDRAQIHNHSTAAGSRSQSASPIILPV